MPVRYETIECKNVLKSLGILATRFWTRFSFDPYVNCELNCTYCNTGVGSNFNNEKDIPTVYAKVNAPEILGKELDLAKRKAVFNMGVMVDPYQPAEEKYRITRKILEVLREHGCPFALGTKSDLILRDLDLIAEASEEVHCCIALSITTMDEKLAKLLEPNAPSPKKRLEVVNKLSREGVMVGVWLTPIIPQITDNDANITSVVKAAKENEAKFILGGALDMRASHKFQSFLKEHFTPHLSYYEKLYNWKNETSEYYPMDFYLWKLYKKFISICQASGIERYIPHFHTRKQALLFYLQNFSRFKNSPIFELTQIFNYLPLSQDFLQIMQIRYGNNAFGKNFLKMSRYFPH